MIVDKGTAEVPYITDQASLQLWVLVFSKQTEGTHFCGILFTAD